MKRILVLLAVMASAGGLAACGGKDNNKSADNSSNTTTAAAANTATSAPAGQTLAVSKNADLGEFLVGPNGHTLYLFEKDSGTTSACATGGCAATWPALAAPSPTAASGVDQAKVSTATGAVPNHVVYNGHLLYFFSGDKAPGDTNGIGIPSWYPVAPSGDKIDKD
ncbi:MAG: hypothetical protein QOJ00_586 [Actinomycetota bacterium]